MPILISLIILMAAWRPLGMAFSMLLQGANQLVYSLFGLQ
jgi:hypothetical protein